MKFSEKLQTLRKESKLSQEQFADMLDVSRQAVSKWESGQTYPEMDKLIAMTKVFKCSLDDLTNDEITGINPGKSKTGVESFISDMLDLINKSFKMFATMDFKSLIGFTMSICILLSIIMLLHLPVEYIYELGKNIFYQIRGGETLSSIWLFILEIAYMIGAIMLFLYAYKVKYLDNFDENKYLEKQIIKFEIPTKTETEKEITSNDKNVKKEKPAIMHKNIPYTSVFSALAKIFMLFIKALLILIEMPFIMTLLCLFIALVICFGIMFKGVFYFGIVLILIASIVLTIIVIEIIYDFIISKKVAAKRIFITIIVAIAVLGAGSGITMLDIAEFKYLEGIQEDLELSVKKEEFLMNETIMMPAYEVGYNYIEQITDETLGDKIIVEIYHHSDFTTAHIAKSSYGLIEVFTTYNNSNKTMFDIIIKDLKNKQIRDYDLLTSYKAKIYGTEKNLKLLEERYNKYSEENKVNQLEEEINSLNNQISQYETKIYELEEKIANLESDDNYLIEEYEIKINECEEKLSDYKNQLKSLIDG